MSNGVKAALISAAAVVVAAIIPVAFPGLFKSTAEHTGRVVGTNLSRNQDVIAKKYEIVALRGDFETIPVSGNVSRMKVSELAPRLGNEMLKIPDGSISFLHAVLKYEYSAYAFMMAAATYDNPQSRIEFADQSISSGEQAKQLVSSAESSQDSKMVEYADWAAKDNTRPRIDYVLAIDYCVKSKEEKSSVWSAKAKQVLDGVPKYFKEGAPPDRNSDLKGCL